MIFSFLHVFHSFLNLHIVSVVDTGEYSPISHFPLPPGFLTTYFSSLPIGRCGTCDSVLANEVWVLWDVHFVVETWPNLTLSPQRAWMEGTQEEGATRWKEPGSLNNFTDQTCSTPTQCAMNFTSGKIHNNKPLGICSSLYRSTCRLLLIQVGKGFVNYCSGELVFFQNSSFSVRYWQQVY